jgi:general secretion pathway protein D
VPASFFSGSQIPFQQGGYNYGGVASYQYTTIPVGINLRVTPFITPDNLVVMQVAQSISGVSAAGNTASGAPPTTDNKEAESIVTVRSGDVILMGGYLDNNKTTSNSGVPGLKDIPLLGNLFRNKSNSGSKTELMILVRPTILPKPSDVAAYTREQRENSGNIQKLEKTFGTDESKSRAAAKKIRGKEEGSKSSQP